MAFYITTPIYYTNDKPHIGHAYTTIACDIISRFNKLNKSDVFFLTGTDEHGQKVEKAAKDAKTDPKKFVDDLSINFKKLIPFLGCEINDFIRTTEERHIKASQAFWNKLLENDQIYLSNYEGWYSVRDEAFYLENELQKINGNFFTLNGSPVEWVKEESYFFKLSNWESKLLEFYNKNPDRIAPRSRYNEVLSFIKSGLKDLSISRTTFKWGVPVPNNDNHVMYVWIDALCNYLTAIDYPDIDKEKYKKYWPAMHIVGKDILRFHAIYWPAFLMAAELEPPKKIFAHGWWTNEGKKISKSLGNTIDPYEIINKYGLDQVRFFLFREVPFGNDGDFSIKALEGRINSDLANDLGNLCQRSLSMVNKHLNNEIQCVTLDKNQLEILQSAIGLNKKLTNFIMCQNISDYIKAVWNLINISNKYFNENEPWKIVKTDIEQFNKILFVTAELIKIIAIYIFPIMPSTSEKIFNFLNLNKENINIDNLKIEENSNYKLNSISALFPRVN